MEIPQSSVVEPPFSQVKMAVCHVIMPRCSGSQSGGADGADGAEKTNLVRVPSGYD